MNAILRAVVGIFETALPGSVRSYDVEGSYADHVGLPASDLDVEVVLAGRASKDVRARAKALAAACAELFAVELDVGIVDVQDLAAGLSPHFKFGSLLLYGEEFRDDLSVVPLDVWTRDRMHTSYYRIATLFGRPEVVTLPLEIPDPEGEFYGYDHRTIRLPDGSKAHGTRDLIRLTGWAATGLIALLAGRYVARKRDCHARYRACIGDEWSAFHDDVYAYCHGRWQYRVPEAAADRLLLRDICARALGFERHFLGIYRDYLLSELQYGTVEAQRDALRPLQYAPFLNADVHSALETLLREGAPELQPAVEETLHSDALWTT